ncbi:MAG: ComF family protein [Candidatus Omnitrophica bacterium]|nr:ComF family protein [Candidatus Omnitrophota bacterium]
MLNILDTILNIVYPPRCLICKKSISVEQRGKPICQICQNSIKKNLPPFCRYCSKHTEDDLPICSNCQNKNFYFDEAFSACVYEGVIKDIIHQFKYKNKDYLGKFLAEILIEFINTYKLPIREFDFVTAVPLHSTKMRQREYNQSLILARYIAKNFKVTLLKDALYKTKNTTSQTELDSQARLKNVIDSFRLNHKINFTDKSILLIDDVLTTGATSSEIARIFKSAGVRRVAVLVLAS